MSGDTSIVCHFYDDFPGNDPILGSLTQERHANRQEQTTLKLRNLPVRRGVATVLRESKDALTLHVQHSGIQWEGDTPSSHPLNQLKAGEILAIRLDITVLYGKAMAVDTMGEYSGVVQS